MTALLRGLLAGLLVIGLAVLGAAPDRTAAQEKKDTKVAPKDPKDAAKDKDELRQKSVSFGTSDGLALNGYFFRGVGIEKQRPDAVMMFPAQGNKVTDAWIGLAKTLSEKNFSVLLFDWRGLGMNAPDTAGARILEDRVKFWNEPYNQQLLRTSQKTIEDKGLDYKQWQGKIQGTYRFKDWMLNDLVAARYFLDRKNDDGQCNTNRVWIVTEKDGGHLALGFIASEFGRNTIYTKTTPGITETVSFKPAGKDYVGLTCLSFQGGNPTASAVSKNSLALLKDQQRQEASDHFEHRLAMVLVFGKKEGISASKSAVSMAGAQTGNEEKMKTDFKYLKEVDNSKQAKTLIGIDLVDPMDSFAAKDYIQKAMVEISKDKQNFGKDSQDREANKTTIVPRFPAEKVSRRAN